MGTTIRIQEQPGTEERSKRQFNLRVIFNDLEFPVTVIDPHDDKTSEKLDWYFEQYLKDPYSPAKTVNSCKTLLRDYGESLFKQVFAGNPDLYNLSRAAFGPDNCENTRVEILGDSPAFQAVLWESIKDPDSEIPPAAQGVVFSRGNSEPRLIEVRPGSFPWINLLVVTSRPGEENEIDNLIIQRSLLKVTRDSKLRVKPHILRPGTYQSLEEHLKETPEGFYHVIHLDVPCEWADNKGLKKAAKGSKSQPQHHYELEDFQPFEGKKALWFFETGKKGMAKAVEADTLARLIESKQIPVCILNAGSSAQPEKPYNGTNGTCCARELIKQGIPSVMVMRCPVSVTAVEILMEVLYEKISGNKSIGAAIAQARQKLYRQKNRKARWGVPVELEDWVLPVVYKNRDVDFNLREFREQEEEAFYKEKERKHFFIEPRHGHGFHGRDADILKIEQQVLQRNHLLLQGQGGVGKTTLLDYLAWWWQETGLVNKVFYFPYDLKAWTVDQIVHDIAQKIYTPRAFESFLIKSYNSQKNKILEVLNTGRHALILDNTEAIAGEGLAIPHTLNPQQKTELKEYLSRITGKSILLLCSRGEETWISEATYRDNVYRLKGFDEETAYDFAGKILAGLGLDFDETVQSPEFRRLVYLLAGNPLALQVVLPNLETDPPGKILQYLQAGVEIEKKNPRDLGRDIITCIEYVHSNISPAVQEFFLCLASFRGAVNFGMTGDYFKELRKFETFKDYPFDKMEGVVEELVKKGFMWEAVPGAPYKIMGLHPVFSYFLKNKLNRYTAPPLVRDLETAFIAYYNRIAKWLGDFLGSNEAEERKKGLFLAKYEYENLSAVLEKQLNRQESIIHPFNTLSRFLEMNNRQQERLAFLEMVSRGIGAYSPEKLNGNLGPEIAGITDSIKKELARAVR